MLISSCVGCSGLQAEMVFVLFFNSSPQCRHWMCDLLPIWSDSSCRYAKDQSHNVWFRADSAFSLSPEVWKNISRQDSDFSPAHSLASDLILSLPMLLVCLGLFHVHYSAVPKITYPSFTWRMQWVQRDGLREARAMITGRCKGKSQEGLAGSCSHPSAAPTLCAPFPAHVLIFSTAALQQMRAEQKCGSVLLCCSLQASTAVPQLWTRSQLCSDQCYCSSLPSHGVSQQSVCAAQWPLLLRKPSQCLPFPARLSVDQSWWNRCWRRSSSPLSSPYCCFVTAAPRLRPSVSWWSQRKRVCNDVTGMLRSGGSRTQSGQVTACTVLAPTMGSLPWAPKDS